MAVLTRKYQSSLMQWCGSTQGFGIRPVWLERVQGRVCHASTGSCRALGGRTRLSGADCLGGCRASGEFGAPAVEGGQAPECRPWCRSVRRSSGGRAPPRGLAHRETVTRRAGCEAMVGVSAGSRGACTHEDADDDRPRSTNPSSAGKLAGGIRTTIPSTIATQPSHFGSAAPRRIARPLQMANTNAPPRTGRNSSWLRKFSV